MVGANELAFTEVGTAFFKAPECGENGYTKAVDVYSFGRCIWQIVNRCGLPVSRNHELKLPAFAPPVLVDLMVRCCNIIDPDARPHFTECVKILELLVATNGAEFDAIDVPCTY